MWVQRAYFYLWFLLLALASASCAHRFGPQEVGIWYEIQSGEQLEQIAAQYGVDPYVIKKRNEIYEAEDLSEGMVIFIPGIAPEPPEPAPETIGMARRKGERRFPKLTDADPIGRSGKRFIWPAKGSISSGFGPRHGRVHEGIDITKDQGDAIYAAGGGVVDFVGRQRGYGNVIIVDHGNGIKTLYGHNKRHLVRKGDRVRQGQKIARIGSTGRSTGPHLHFEVRVHDRARNPMRYLPLR